TITDRGTGSDGQNVVKVETRDGTVLGWTNEGNLRFEKNPVFSSGELGEIALDVLTSPDVDIDGIDACDPRIGVGGLYHNTHIDVKPQPWGAGGAYWPYDDATDCNLVVQARGNRNTNQGCSSTHTAPYDADTDRTYVVASDQAWLRDPDSKYETADTESNPLLTAWTETQDVCFDSQNSAWEVQEGTRVGVAEKIDNPEDHDAPIAKVEAMDGTVLGWINFSNLEFLE
ncbi:MAG: hypothetical protein V5A18_10660, partial [Haloarculaceae archaeon]